MKNFPIDAALIAARPQKTLSKSDFTDRVMNAIQSPEILSSRLRRMNVTNKETFFMKLKHLPKFAIIAIAIASLLIISTGAYAAYQLLWAKPQVHLTQSTTSVSGRQEAILRMSGCDSSQTSRYELKKGATISADRIPAVVQAQCELKAIDTWAQGVYGDKQLPDLNTLRTDGPPAKDTLVLTSMATHLETKQSDSVTFAALPTYGMSTETYSTNNSVTYIVDGKQASRNAIREGDAVAYVTTKMHTTTLNKDGSMSTDNSLPQTLVAVVKLSMPFEDYDQFAWQSLSERQACYGNSNEDCVTGGASIDLYMGGSDVALSETKIMKEIQGTVVALNGTSTSIRSSSGTIFTVTTPTDVISEYNTNKAGQFYNNQKVKIGSSIDVQYIEDTQAHATNITAAYMRFQIELVSKADPVKAY